MKLVKRVKASKPATLALFPFCIVCIAYLIICSSVARRIFAGEARDPCTVLEQRTPLVIYSKLPKIIHQMIDRSNGVVFSPHVDKWQETFRQTYPSHEIMIWDDAMLLELIREDFAWFLPYYTKYPRNIQRVDAARCFILYKYGGLYADIDIEVHADFWPRLPDHVPAVMQSIWLHEKTQNAFMSSPPGHPFWRFAWDLMAIRANVTSQAWDVLWTTGPTLIDDAIDMYSAYLSVTDTEEEPVRILPCENWNRMSVREQTSLGLLWNAITARQFGKSRLCGDIEDKTCLLIEHHSMVSWNSP